MSDPTQVTDDELIHLHPVTTPNSNWARSDIDLLISVPLAISRSFAKTRTFQRFKRTKHKLKTRPTFSSTDSADPLLETPTLQFAEPEPPLIATTSMAGAMHDPPDDLSSSTPTTGLLRGAPAAPLSSPPPVRPAHHRESSTWDLHAALAAGPARPRVPFSASPYHASNYKSTLPSESQPLHELATGLATALNTRLNTGSPSVSRTWTLSSLLRSRTDSGLDTATGTGTSTGRSTVPTSSSGSVFDAPLSRVLGIDTAIQRADAEDEEWVTDISSLSSAQTAKDGEGGNPFADPQRRVTFSCPVLTAAHSPMPRSPSPYPCRSEAEGGAEGDGEGQEEGVDPFADCFATWDQHAESVDAAAETPAMAQRSVEERRRQEERERIEVVSPRQGPGLSESTVEAAAASLARMAPEPWPRSAALSDDPAHATDPEQGGAAKGWRAGLKAVKSRLAVKPKIGTLAERTPEKIAETTGKQDAKLARREEKAARRAERKGLTYGFERARSKGYVQIRPSAFKAPSEKELAKRERKAEKVGAKLGKMGTEAEAKAQWSVRAEDRQEVEVGFSLVQKIRAARHRGQQIRAGKRVLKEEKKRAKGVQKEVERQKREEEDKMMEQLEVDYQETVRRQDREMGGMDRHVRRELAARRRMADLMDA